MLAGIRARARGGIVIEAAGAIAVAFLVHGVVSYTLDRWLHLEVAFRAVLLIALALFLWRIASRRLVAPLRTTLDDGELALAVERQDPQLHQALISALEFDDDLRAGRDHGESAAMMRSVIDDVERRVGAIAFLRALDARRVARFLGLAGFGLVAFASWFVLGGAEARLWARRDLLLGSEAWPRNTWLSWDEIDASAPLRIAEREDLRLRVAVRGIVPERVELRGRFAGGEEFVRPMDRIGADRFAVTLETLLEDADVRAVGGDGETPPLAIRLVARPRVTELAITVEFPEYMGKQPEELSATGGDVRVPRGSTLTLVGKSSKPLRKAELVFGQDHRTPIEIEGPDARAMRVRFAPETGGELLLEVLDTDDLGPTAPPMLHLSVVDDAPPTLEFETSGIGSSITANARIPGVLKVRDDYGIATVTASFRTMAATAPDGGEKPPEPAFEAAPVVWQDELEVGGTEADLGVVFDLLPLSPNAEPGAPENRIQPGTLLSVRFEATDVHAPDAHRGQSEVLNLRIVTRDQLLEDLTRRQLEQRTELERVRQKEVEARAELSDILSSTSADPRASSAKLRVESLARQQLALGKKVQGIGERYGRIVDEMVNNRLFEPAVTRSLAARIVEPLGQLAREDFPRSATLVETFANTGEESARDDCLAAYDDIIARLQALIDQMETTESIAALVESLKGVIRTEREVDDLIQGLRQEQGEGVFGPGSTKDEDQKPGEKPGGENGERKNR